MLRLGIPLRKCQLKFEIIQSPRSSQFQKPRIQGESSNMTQLHSDKFGHCAPFRSLCRTMGAGRIGGMSKLRVWRWEGVP